MWVTAGDVARCLTGHMAILNALRLFFLCPSRNLPVTVRAIRYANFPFGYFPKCLCFLGTILLLQYVAIPALPAGTRFGLPAEWTSPHVSVDC